MGGVVVNETDSADGTGATVRVLGEIDADASNELRTVLVDLVLRRKPDRITVDLLDVTALDSAAVGMLRAASDAACDVNVTLVVQTSNGGIADDLGCAGVPVGLGTPRGDGMLAA